MISRRSAASIEADATRRAERRGRPARRWRWRRWRPEPAAPAAPPVRRPPPPDPRVARLQLAAPEANGAAGRRRASGGDPGDRGDHPARHPWVIRLTMGACVVLVAGTVVAVLGTDSAGGDTLGRLGSHHQAASVALLPAVIVNGTAKQFRAEGVIIDPDHVRRPCIYLLMLIPSDHVRGDRVISSRSLLQPRGGRTPPRTSFYFSYATLTTIGYGDLVASTHRPLAGRPRRVIGQIYMVSVVALIVSNIGSAPRRRIRQ